MIAMKLRFWLFEVKSNPRNGLPEPDTGSTKVGRNFNLSDADSIVSIEMDLFFRPFNVPVKELDEAEHRHEVIRGVLGDGAGDVLQKCPHHVFSASSESELFCTMILGLK